MTDFSCQVLGSIRTVAEQDWNRAIGTAIGVSHAVLSCYESGGHRADQLRYVVLRDDDGIEAVAVALLVPPRDRGLGQMVLGRLARITQRFASHFCPALICGLLRGPGAPVLVRPGKPTAIWLPRILDALEAYAAEQRVAIGFYGIEPEQAELAGELHERGYASGYGLPDARIAVTWRDEAEYLKALRAKSKNAYSGAKAEMTRFRRSGIVVEEWDGERETELYDLLRTHHEERNIVPFEMPAGFLSLLRQKLGRDLLVCVARRGQVVVGVVLVLMRKTQGWLWKVGIDHADDAGSFTYFNLTFYHIFAQAPALGIERIYCGNAALFAKSRRGCRIEMTGFMYKPRAAWSTPFVRLLFRQQRAWYRRKFAPYLSSARDERVSDRRARPT